MTAQLEVQNGPRAGETLPIDRLGSLTIGRDSENDLVIDDQAVSREHCRVDYDGEFYWVVDKDSHNGTVVNGRSVTKSMLFDGDVIKIGHVHVQFHLAADQQ